MACLDIALLEKLFPHEKKVLNNLTLKATLYSSSVKVD